MTGETAPSSVESPALTPTGMSLVLDTALTMTWMVSTRVGGGNQADIELTYAGVGWVGFGVPSTAGAMVGAQALIGQPGSL